MNPGCTCGRIDKGENSRSTRLTALSNRSDFESSVKHFWSVNRHSCPYMSGDGGLPQATELSSRDSMNISGMNLNETLSTDPISKPPWTRNHWHLLWSCDHYFSHRQNSAGKTHVAAGLTWPCVFVTKILQYYYFTSDCSRNPCNIMIYAMKYRISAFIRF